jgi:hypothetical protein
VLGKDEVTGSIPVSSLKNKNPQTPIRQGFAGFLFFAKTNVRSRTNVRFCTFGDSQSRDPRRDLLRMVLNFSNKK